MIKAILKTAILTIAVAMMLGCEKVENRIQTVDRCEIMLACLNGHLYIKSYTHLGDYVYTPYFDAGSDIPKLVKCPRAKEQK